MNPFNKHPERQGVSYSSHFVFAMGIAIRLLHSVVAFASHAIFPFIDIRRSLDLEATTNFLQERNIWIESRKSFARSYPVTQYQLENSDHLEVQLLEHKEISS